MKIGKVKKVHKNVPAPIPIVLPKPKSTPAPEIFRPEKKPVEVR